jgi:hypothetical protein
MIDLAPRTAALMETLVHLRNQSVIGLHANGQNTIGQNTIGQNTIGGRDD